MGQDDASSLRPDGGPMRPKDAKTSLQSEPTTAISSVDIQTLSFPDGSRGTFSTPGTRAVSTPLSRGSGSGSGHATPARSQSGGEEMMARAS
ncbi:unnamed protein product [Parascedosporium putredinis]|uniref:Uncharacterized protein n=1 Tax=Parascedosporium putredinis TaxID=1442378 RepID=A0A9P1MCT4_9PEZI|nr:unnamed protein product [Parascedosporium putredinis]CAI7999008.1 unnamed protein product [Parascedosporium putredinis]